jgi:hypothetical protein
VRVVDHAALPRGQDRHGLDDARGRGSGEEKRGGDETGDDGGATDAAPYPLSPVALMTSRIAEIIAFPSSVFPTLGLPAKLPG